MARAKLLSGVFLVRPKKLLTLNSGGMIRLTPKKVYKAFKTSYEIKNQPGHPTIMIVKEDEKGVRWFPVTEGYARNNFDYVKDNKINDQKYWLNDFARRNEHIRTKELLEFII